jgi:hypothetical protein
MPTCAGNGRACARVGPGGRTNCRPRVPHKSIGPRTPIPRTQSIASNTSVCVADPQVQSHGCSLAGGPLRTHTLPRHTCVNHVHIHVTCRGKARGPAFPECGGSVVSVPVVWFNNQGGWKKLFMHPGRTFVVAMVEHSNHTTRRHDMCILGAPAGDNFELDQNAFAEFRALWEAHGGRMLPSYEITGPGTIEAVDLTKSPPKPKRRGTQGTCVLHSCTIMPCVHTPL